MRSSVQLGTSVEDQATASERIPHLQRCPAAVRFVSAEPLLGRLDLTPWLDKLDWVIAGAESGHGARPMNEDWVRALRDQCVDAGVAFFYKQNAVNGRKIHTPELDGVQWMQYPALRVEPGDRRG